MFLKNLAAGLRHFLKRVNSLLVLTKKQRIRASLCLYLYPQKLKAKGFYSKGDFHVRIH